MNPDIKKFITGFLMLAAIAGSASFLAFNLPINNSTDNNTDRTNDNNRNAFVESVPLDSIGTSSDQIVQDFEPQINDPSNLTENIAAIYAKEIVKANPDGPQANTSIDGMNVYLPDKDMSAVIAKIAMEQGIDSKVPTKPEVIEHFTSKDVSNYFARMKGIMGDTFLSDKFVSSAADAETGLIMADQAYNQALLTKVPRPLADTHKSFIEAAYVHKKMYEAATDPSADPLKSIFLVNNATEITTKSFSRVINNLDEVRLADLNPNKTPLTMLADAFRPEMANAQAKSTAISFAAGLLVPIVNGPQVDACTGATRGIDKVKQKIDDTVNKVTDKVIGKATDAAKDALGIDSVLSGDIPVSDKSLLSVMTKDACVNAKSKDLNIKKVNEETFVQMFMGRIIDLVQNQIINWISGGGKPKFITNWTSFIKDTGDEAVGMYLGKYYPKLCGNLGIQMNAFFSPTPYLNTTPPTCTLTSVKNNLINFYNDFRSGGWVSYGQVIQPQNNYWGNLVLTSDYLDQKKAAAQSAATQEANWGNGFKSIKKCTNWGSGPVIETSVCQQYGKDKDGLQTCIKWGSQKDPSACQNWETVTPGNYVQQQLGIALKFKSDRLVNAKRLNDLIAAVIDASMNRVMKMGLSQVSALASSGGGSGYSNNYNNITDDSQYAQMGQSGGNGVLNDIGQVQINDASSSLQSAKETNAEWLNMQPVVLGGLDAVDRTCFVSSSTLSQAAIDLKKTVSATTIDVNAEMDRINILLGSFANGTVLSGDMTEAQSIYENSTARLGTLQNIKDTIDVDLASSTACSVSF